MKWRKIKTIYPGMCEELAQFFGVLIDTYSTCTPTENLIINDMGFSKDVNYRCAAGIVEDGIVIQRLRGNEPGGMVILPNDDFETLFEVTSDNVQKHERQFYDAEKDQES